MPYLDKELFVEKSLLPGAGKGLFTKVDIEKGSRICRYTGAVMTWKEALEKLPDTTYCFYINKNCVIDGRQPMCLGSFANDAKGTVRVPYLKNNATFQTVKNNCYIVATKKILAYSEIFVSYGLDYWPRQKKTVDIEIKKKGTKINKRKEIY